MEQSEVNKRPPAVEDSDDETTKAEVEAQVEMTGCHKFSGAAGDGSSSFYVAPETTSSFPPYGESEQRAITTATEPKPGGGSCSVNKMEEKTQPFASQRQDQETARESPRNHRQDHTIDIPCALIDGSNLDRGGAQVLVTDGSNLDRGGAQVLVTWRQRLFAELVRPDNASLTATDSLAQMLEFVITGRFRHCPVLFLPLAIGVAGFARLVYSSYIGEGISTATALEAIGLAVNQCCSAIMSSLNVDPVTKMIVKVVLAYIVRFLRGFLLPWVVAIIHFFRARA